MSNGYKDLESGAGSGGVSALVNEALGTFFLCYALMNATDATFGLLAIGGVLAFWTWWEADGMYNPAVTLSYLLRNAINLRSAALAVLAQTGGAFAAVWFSSLTGGASFDQGTGSLVEGLTDALLIIVLLYTYANDETGLGRGLSYYACLSAFASPSGANAAVVLGSMLAGATQGNGIDLGLGVLVGTAAPLVGAAAIAFVAPLLTSAIGEKISAELVGTFFFGLMSFAITATGATGSALALGATLYTLSNGFKGAALNPLVSVAQAVGRRDSVSLMVNGLDVLRTVLIQVGGALLAAVVGTFLGSGASVPEAAALGADAAFEAIFASVIALVYLAGKGADLVVGLTYFAAVASFASSFNPAFPLGLYAASQLGFGSTALAITSTLGPLVGGVAAGLLSGKTSSGVQEALGVLVLVLVLCCTDQLGGLALGCMLAALSTIFAGATFNPALTLAQPGGASSPNLATIGFQIGGGLGGAILASWGGVADGASVSTGLDGFKPAAAEALLIALLVKAYSINANENGLAYFALLAVFGSAAGSIANPAVTLGGWIGNGVLGSGFDLDVSALLGLTSHVAAPIVGALASAHLFRALEGAPLERIGLSTKEFFASFLMVTAAAGIDGASGVDSLALVAALMTVFLLYRQADTDVFPAVSAYRAFGNGLDGLGFVKRLTAQTLGALAAAILATWLFGSAGGAGAVDAAPADALRNGILWAIFLCWAYDYVALEGNVDFVLVVFSAALLFGYFNSAALLGTALVDAASADGGFINQVKAFLGNPAWVAAFAAPLVGGAAAGRLLPALGRKHKGTGLL